MDCASCRCLAVSGLVGLSLAASACGAGGDERPLVPPSEDASADASVDTASMAIASEAATQPFEASSPPPVVMAEARIPAAPPVRQLVRGMEDLEGKCLARVGALTSATVLGTRRIDEAADAIEIYVNVEGAQAPWLCRGNRDGSIVRVMNTDGEG